LTVNGIFTCGGGRERFVKHYYGELVGWEGRKRDV